MNYINEIQIKYKRKPLKGGVTTDKILNSKTAYLLLKSRWNLNTLELIEEFKVLLLNNANEPNGIYSAASGGLTSCMLDIRLLFGIILKTATIKIILFHNHPSGTLRPSQADINLTNEIKKVAEIMKIEVIDHIILTIDSYYSFADEGNL
jgi:DNA repair protein RadC